MKFSAENFLFLVSGAATYALIQYLSRSIPNRSRDQKQCDTTKKSFRTLVNEELEEDDETNIHKPGLSPAIEKELFSRNITFFGEDGQRKIRNAYVIVVGLGGVGSHCAHMLARSGVGKMKVIDFDQVTLSSLNRHATASFSDVGQPKVEVLKATLADMAPACEVHAVNRLFHAAEAWNLLLPLGERRPDFVVDAIDDVNTKIELLLFCQEQKLRVISALSAGAKGDPTRMHIGTMADAVKDPLAVKIRYKLRKQGVDAESIPVLYSSERQSAELIPLNEEQEKNPEEFGIVDHFRVRVIPVLGTMPALFGQALASHVLCELAGKPFTPQPVPRLKTTTLNKIYQQLRNTEMRNFGNSNPAIDQATIEHVINQVWKQKCAVTGKRLGGGHLPVLVRWKRHVGPVPNNLVLLMPNEAKKLEEKGQEAFAYHASQQITQKLSSMGDDWG